MFSQPKKLSSFLICSSSERFFYHGPANTICFRSNKLSNITLCIYLKRYSQPSLVVVLILAKAEIFKLSLRIKFFNLSTFPLL